MDKMAVHPLHAPFSRCMIKQTPPVVRTTSSFPVDSVSILSNYKGRCHSFLHTTAGSSFSGPWYTDSTDRPIKRLKTNLQIAFPSPSVVAFPTDDTECDLTATKNIFGRYANGVSSAAVCTQTATKANVRGKFVHAEQDAAARSDTSYARWTTAIEDTFATA